MAACSICAHLTPDVWWDDILGEARDEPAEFRRLDPLPREVYRCPECGAYYDRKESSSSFINSDFTQHWLQRRPSDAAESDRIRVHDFIRQQDLVGLDRFLRAPNQATQIVILDVLEGYVVEKALDIAPFEEAIRSLFTGPDDLQAAAARVLTHHLIRSGRQADVTSLFSFDSLNVQRGTLHALVLLQDRFNLRPLLDSFRPFLARDDHELRISAQLLVSSVGLAPGEAAMTVKDAIRRLGSPRPGERAAAASILADAAQKGVGEIGPALPRLQQLLREKGADQIDRDAERAFIGAVAHGVKLPSKALPDLVERFRQSERIELVHTFRQMHERGEDISAAFEALAAIGGSWPLELLKRAAEKGDDLSAAVATLQKIVNKTNHHPNDSSITTSEGRTAAYILACHFAYRKKWSDLGALVRDAAPKVVGGCVSALGELARLHKCELSGAVPVLRNIAKIGDESVRWGAQNALSFIPLE